MFGNQIWCAVHVSNNTDAHHKTQTTTASNEAESEGAQASTLQDREGKECTETETSEETSEETETTEEQSSLSEEVSGK